MVPCGKIQEKYRFPDKKTRAIETLLSIIAIHSIGAADMAAQIAIMYDASGDDDSIDITIGTSRDNDTGNDIGLAANAVKLMMICTKKQLLPRMLARGTVNREWHPFDIAVSSQ